MLFFEQTEISKELSAARKREQHWSAAVGAAFYGGSLTALSLVAGAVVNFCGPIIGWGIGDSSLAAPFLIGGIGAFGTALGVLFPSLSRWELANEALRALKVEERELEIESRAKALESTSISAS